MILELHLIQNFAPSNLNRSDTGSPKDCEFGGVRRARVSSQCFKRAMRQLFKEGELFTDEQKKNLADRTKLLAKNIKDKLIEAGKEEEISSRAVKIVLDAANLKLNEKNQTDFLVFVGKKEAQAIADICLKEDKWASLLEIDSAYEKGRKIQSTIAELEAQGKSGSKEEKQQIRARIKDAKEGLKEAQKEAKKAIPSDIEKAVLDALDGGKAADLALFGRMIATLPDKNRDAASQVAQAISTHKVGMEFDFYTAVDDLLPREETGAGMLGTIEFNSACFYRYLNVDTKLLRTNLQEDEDLVAATIEAFVNAAIEAVPNGKQNRMAAQNLPSCVLAVVRKSGSWSLANAFETPIRPTKENGKEKGLIENSMLALDDCWQQHVDTYGDEQVLTKAYFALSGKDLPNLNGARVKSKAELIAKIREALETKGA